MYCEKKDFTKEILTARSNDNLSITLKQIQKLNMYALLGGTAMLVIAMLEENRVYIPYALYTLMEFALVYFCFREFQKVGKYRFLFLGFILFWLLYLLERFHLGELFEPMKDRLPTVMHPGGIRSVGLVKSIAVMMPALYFWTKVVFGLIWAILFFATLRLKRITF